MSAISKPNKAPITNICMDYESTIFWHLRYKLITKFIQASRPDPHANTNYPPENPVQNIVFHELTAKCQRDKVNGKNRNDLIQQAFRKRLHSQTFLHTYEPFTPTPSSEDRSMLIWRDGEGKLSTHLALHLTHLKNICFGNVVVLPNGTLCIYYFVKYHWWQTPKRHAQSLRVTFSYCILSAQRQFSVDPDASHAPASISWLEKYCQQLPRTISKRRSGVIDPGFFAVRFSHLERAAFGVPTIVRPVEQAATQEASHHHQQAGAEAEEKREAEETKVSASNGTRVDACVHDAMRPVWYWGMQSILAKSSHPSAASAAAKLQHDHSCRSTTELCSRLITGNKYSTPAAAVVHASKFPDGGLQPADATDHPSASSCSSASGASERQPTPATFTIADRTYDPTGARTQAKEENQVG